MYVETATDAHAEQAKHRGALCASCVVWLTWGVLALMVTGFVVKYHNRFPFADEYVVFRYSLGEDSVSLSWLWQPHNEHRIFIGKLIYVALARLTHCNWSVLPILHVCLLATLSAALLLCLRRARGRLKYTDALVPVLLLSFGQYENLLHGFQLCFVLWFVSACYLVFLIWMSPNGLTGLHAVGAGACLLAQPLSGSQGLPYGVALSFWYAANGMVALRSATGIGRRCQAMAMLVVAVMTVAGTGFYFVGLGQHHPPHWHCPDLFPFLRGMCEFLTAAWKPGDNRSLQRLTVALFALCVCLCCLRLYRNQDRLRAFGMLMCLAAELGLAAEVSFGRAFLGQHCCAAPRYVTLALPGLLACYCILEMSNKPGLTRAVQVSMLAAALLSFQGNYTLASYWGKHLRRNLRDFQKDVNAELTTHELAERHYKALCVPERAIDALSRHFELMKRDRLYPFANQRGTQGN
jgi:hypothetical protein